MHSSPNGPLDTARPFLGALANGLLSVGPVGGSIFNHDVLHAVVVIALFIQLSIVVADVIIVQDLRVVAGCFKFVIPPLPNSCAKNGRLIWLPSVAVQL